MLEYFNEARIKEGVATTAYPTVSMEDASKLPPDFIFDILETPLRDLGGDVIYENDDRGNLVPARRFSPEFWNERYQTFRLLEEVNLREIGEAVEEGNKINIYHREVIYWSKKSLSWRLYDKTRTF